MQIYVDNSQIEQVARVLAPHLQKAVPDLNEEEAYEIIRWDQPEQLLGALIEDLLFNVQNLERVGLVKGKFKPDEDCVWFWNELVGAAKIQVGKKTTAAEATATA